MFSLLYTFKARSNHVNLIMTSKLSPITWEWKSVHTSTSIRRQCMTYSLIFEGLIWLFIVWPNKITFKLTAVTHESIFPIIRNFGFGTDCKNLTTYSRLSDTKDWYLVSTIGCRSYDVLKDGCFVSLIVVFGMRLKMGRESEGLGKTWSTMISFPKRRPLSTIMD